VLYDALTLWNEHYEFPKVIHSLNLYVAGGEGSRSVQDELGPEPKLRVSAPAKADNTASAQFGWAASNPLLALPGQGKAGAPLPARSSSLREVPLNPRDQGSHLSSAATSR